MRILKKRSLPAQVLEQPQLWGVGDCIGIDDAFVF